MEIGNSTSKLVISFFLMTVTLSGCAAKAPKVESVMEKPAELVGFAEKNAMQLEKSNVAAIDALDLSSLADRAYEMEEWVVAEKYYRRLIGHVPQSAYGYFRLGNVLMQRSEVDGAINAYNKSIQLDPSNLRALKNRSLAFLLKHVNYLDPAELIYCKRL